MRNTRRLTTPIETRLQRYQQFHIRNKYITEVTHVYAISQITHGCRLTVGISGWSNVGPTEMCYLGYISLIGIGDDDDDVDEVLRMSSHEYASQSKPSANPRH